MLTKLHAMKIDVMLYERYVDDINICTNALSPGTKFIEGSLQIYEEEIHTTELAPKDKRTMDLIKQIGDSIHPSIILESDVPSNHEDGKVPILDLKVWISEAETQTEGERRKRRIMHEFYSKDVSSKLLIHKDAALSLNTKRIILTQQCLRVILNCSPYLKRGIVENHLTYFMLRMQCSGYDRPLRYEVLKSACNAFDKIKEKGVNEGVPIYRSKRYRRSQRRKEKDLKKKDWYKKDGNEAVMFIPSTPNSELRKEMQTYIDSSDSKIKVIERSGTKMIRLLQKNDPFNDTECRKDDCFVCTTSKSGNCRTSGVIYKIECKEGCPFIYHGQTSSNAYTRGLKHLEDYAKKRDKFMWKHCVNEHNGERINFKMTIIRGCRNDSTKRQIMEGIFIQKTDPSITLNEKAEWNGVRIPRITIE